MLCTPKPFFFSTGIPEPPVLTYMYVRSTALIKGKNSFRIKVCNSKAPLVLVQKKKKHKNCLIEPKFLSGSKQTQRHLIFMRFSPKGRFPRPRITIGTLFEKNEKKLFVPLYCTSTILSTIHTLACHATPRHPKFLRPQIHMYIQTIIHQLISLTSSKDLTCQIINNIRRIGLLRLNKSTILHDESYHPLRWTIIDRILTGRGGTVIFDEGIHVPHLLACFVFESRSDNLC